MTAVFIFLMSLVAANIVTDGGVKHLVDAEVMPHIEKHVSADVNPDTGLTDFDLLDSEFSLLVEPRYEFND